MGSIIILDENTSNKIAAGEVVDKPASVVKELVENSIDAGATSISVDIRNGGISAIRVTDNGKGISEDDVVIAFERHATSKIKRAEDLDSILTMGFRGEALASIASVSNVELQTKTADSTYGMYVSISGGNIQEVRQTGCNVGTSITIRDLFFNTPARYKFLKKDSTEAGYISDSLTRIALGYPEIAFSLTSNRINALRTPGNGDLKSTIFSIYGREVVKDLIEVNFSDEKLKVHGYVGKPEAARANRNYQSLFINRRYVKSRLVSYAVEQAYSSILMKNRFPFFVLNITLNPLLVDANVHPQKMEVRFADESYLTRTIYMAVASALSGKELFAPVTVTKKDRELFKFSGAEKKEYVQQTMDISSDAINHKGSVSKQGIDIKANDVGKHGIDIKADDVSRHGVEIKSDDVSRHGVEIKSDDVSKHGIDIKTVDVAKQTIDVSNNTIKTPEMHKFGSQQHTQVDYKKINSVMQQQPSQATDKQVTAQLHAQLSKLNDNSIGLSSWDVNENNGSVQSMQMGNAVGPEQPTQPTHTIRESGTEKPVIHTEHVQSVRESYTEKPLIHTEDVQSMYSNEQDSGDASTQISTNDSTISHTETLQHSVDSNNLLSMRYIGQAFFTYILLQNGDELVMVDQHAAHERIIYERLKIKYESMENLTQLLLEPVVLHLQPVELICATSNEELFSRIGMVFEDFGNNSIIIRGVPYAAAECSPAELFQELLNKLQNSAKPINTPVADEILHTVACKAAIKANKKLSEAEVQQLLLELSRTGAKYTCPHGRPTVIRLTKYEIEKMFKRIV